MTEIRHTGEVSSPARSRRLRPALMAAAVATAAAAALTFLPPSGGDEPAATASATVLEDIALAAEHENAYGTVRDDQFVYVDAQVSYARRSADGKRTGIVPAHRVETWEAVDARRDGLVRDAADPRGEHALAGLPPGNRFHDQSSSYDSMKSLPTTAAGMYAWLTKASGAGATFHFVTWKDSSYVEDRQQAMFLVAGDVINTAIVPPAQSAALYRAVARIPGVEVDEDAVDALGRHGVAISRTDGTTHVRAEWIFDGKTHELLGQRETVTRDYAGLKKGTVVLDTAIQRRAVVDKAGLRP